MGKGFVFETDRRITCAAEELLREGNEVVRLTAPEDAALLRNPGDADFVILPIRGTADGTIPVPGGVIRADDFLQTLPEKTVVISGISTPYEESLRCRYFNFQKDPDYVRKNSQYTAEGVLLLLLSETPASIFSYSYDLLGDGNTGRAIAPLLRRLGLSFRWITAEGGEGKKQLSLWQRHVPADVIINTIPAPVILASQFENFVPDGSREDGAEGKIYIFDISSGGKGMADEDKHLPCVVYKNTPPLPGLAAPASAGHLMVELLRKLMAENGSRQD
ncbi:MAG: hypothetical protein ACOX8B_09595 [Lachnospiraceae bacterium]|jgi:hypothetical protein